MKIYYKLLILGLIIYISINIIKERFENRQYFHLPKVNIDKIKEEQEKHKKSFFQYNPEETLRTGQGVSDRIRYDGKWN